MARDVMTEKKKKKNKKTKAIVIICILLVVLGLSGFLLYKKFHKPKKGDAKTVVVLDSIDNYGYDLNDNDSDLFADEYKKLKAILNKDEVDTEEYVKQVSKMFIIDLYSLDAKINKYNIGGKEFFYSDKVVMFEQKVMDTIYELMLDDTYGDRKQELPLVKSVDVQSAEKTVYKLGENKVDAYLVKLTWSYEKNMGYDYQGSVVLCKDGDVKWSVVDFQPTLDPEYK